MQHEKKNNSKFQIYKIFAYLDTSSLTVSSAVSHLIAEGT